ncbi:hypothetical protein HD806DRAFT_527715 [Xylariaceae sp. AK1471]|nr:hypothetical protein HD806DRAFT_527715 [Xylariaceae sp. AK1471]
MESPRGKRINEYTNVFCGLISTGEQVRLPLAYLMMEFKFKGPKQISRAVKFNKPSIPPGQVKRLVLSFLKAKATWQYYESNWMAKEWNKNMVHSPLHVQIPASRDWDISDSSGDCQGAGARVIHRFPETITLGFMLIEINLGVKIKDFRIPQRFGPDGNPSADADAIITENRFKGEKKWKETSETLKNAIRLCTNPEKVVKKLSRGDLTAQRERLLQPVVKPLRRLCLKTFEGRFKSSAINFPVPVSKPGAENQPFTLNADSSGNDSDCYDNRDKDPEVECTIGIQASLGIASDEPMSACSSPLALGIINYELQVVSCLWKHGFSLIAQLKNFFRAKAEDKDEYFKRVKMAVLDTGIHETYSRLAQNIYKNYLSLFNYPTDTSSSHYGTSVCRLILKTCKDEEICAARVFEQDKVNSDLVVETQEWIAKAIQYNTAEVN